MMRQYPQQINTLAEQRVSVVPSCYRRIMPGGHKCLGTRLEGFAFSCTVDVGLESGLQMAAVGYPGQL